MKRNIVIDRIKDRISTMEKGAVLTISDFLDIANYDAAKNALSKLEKDGILTRELRGIYKISNYNKVLKIEVPANPDEIAKAIAKNNKWTIIPKGDSALNILGLSTQVPAVCEYISDGPSKEYDYGKFKLKMHKRSNKYISGVTKKSGLVIEAIKTIGQKNMNDDYRKMIAGQLSQEDMAMLLADGRVTARWINEEIIKILIEGGLDVRNS